MEIKDKELHRIVTTYDLIGGIWDEIRQIELFGIAPAIRKREDRQALVVKYVFEGLLTQMDVYLSIHIKLLEKYTKIFV